MKRSLAPLLALTASAALAFAAVSTPGDGGLPATYSVRDPAAPPVTAANVMASERFWPYQVALTEDASVGEPARVLRRGTTGVLLRAEPAGGGARMDFGRDGLWTLPLAQTDLLARANAIRLGTETKAAPNFVLALGPRALDAAKSPPVPPDLGEWTRQTGFLCVFADPAAPEFAALAAELRAPSAAGRYLPLLFPMRGGGDVAVAARLRALDWPVAFVRSHLAEPYAAGLLAEPYAAPSVLLVTTEGRVLHRAPWQAGAGEAVRAAMARNARTGQRR
jgi:hypothetical protein